MTEERVIYNVAGDGNAPIRETALLEYSDSRYTPPEPDEIRAALHLASLTGREAADLLGVSTGRTIRKWVGGEQAMPYAAWRLLIDRAGLLEWARAVHGNAMLDSMQMDWWARWVPAEACWRIVGEVLDISRGRLGTAAMWRFGFHVDLPFAELELLATEMCRDQLLLSTGGAWTDLPDGSED